MLKWEEMETARKGKISEMEVIFDLMKSGFDLYLTIADDQGIDAILRFAEDGRLKYFDIQIKTIRDSYGSDFNKLLCPSDFRDNYILILAVTYATKKPGIFFITKETASLIQVSPDTRYKGYLNLAALGKEKPAELARIKIDKLPDFLGAAK
ncbi:MAG: hypothetical protein A2117_01370 [Candidatus Wildermuthbacteria bacterium GWA2_46_15]|uniref:DUF4365 domain-containing protein n=1 Tax=Candidatus Wildermuthbacteria bacterium GWA2_46_15 TaxID=1802443 RepID=A0A1G2QQS9_9BACT|nr:MAG: hypothetical protein A2117_01370 [Candidatus Wildermuthbacteria bacterium GWA2_46_15]